MSNANTTATDLLVQASAQIDHRAQLRDQPDGERSMARTVRAFNAIYSQNLTEQQGWQFMVLLKMARGAAGRPHLDDLIDQAGYTALAGECVARRVPIGQLPAAFNHDSPDCAGHSKPFAAT